MLLHANLHLVKLILYWGIIWNIRRDFADTVHIFFLQQCPCLYVLVGKIKYIYLFICLCTYLLGVSCWMTAWMKLGNTLSGRLGKVVASHAASHCSWLPRIASRSIPAEVRCTSRSGGTAHEDRGATSQLDLPSLTPLSVAGCGWLQLGIPNWAASVHYCK